MDRNFAEEFKRRIANVDKPAAAPKPRFDPEPATEPEQLELFNIYKRTSDRTVNKCVGIGFTYAEAEEWLERKVNKAKVQGDRILFYDIVAQDNAAAKSALWNETAWIQEMRDSLN